MRGKPPPSKGITGNTMAFLLFWLKLFIKRTLTIIKSSPVIAAGCVIIIAAFVYAGSYISITLDKNSFIVILAFAVSAPFFALVKDHNMLGKKIFYAKSGYSNPVIQNMFIFKTVVGNNILLLLFWALCILKTIVFPFSLNAALIPGVFIGSTLISFVILSLKVNSRKIKSTKSVRAKISPLVKSSWYDYAEIVPAALIITALMLFVSVGFLGNRTAINNADSAVFIPLTMFVILAIAFAAIISAVSHTNWLFYTLVSLDFKRQFRRVVLFTASFYGIALLQYFFVTAYLNTPLLFVYTLAMLLNLAYALVLAFYPGNVLKKLLVYVIIVRVLLYVQYTNPYFVLIAVVPFLLLLILTRARCMEWIYL
jgi:hypothetical protein